MKWVRVESALDLRSTEGRAISRGLPAIFVPHWNKRRAGALWLRSTHSRTRVAQKGRLLPHKAPFPFLALGRAC
jgi:hypothetical protein